MVLTVREKVERWLAKAPDELIILNVSLEPLIRSIDVVGRLTPLFVDNGYEGSITFKCNTWDEKTRKESIIIVNEEP